MKLFISSLLIILLLGMQSQSVQHSLEHFSHQETTAECSSCACPSSDDTDLVSTSISELPNFQKFQTSCAIHGLPSSAYDASKDIRGPPQFIV